MARETWKCPYTDCKQESSRYWNLVRHIDRQHGGERVPVKNKSTIDTESILDTQIGGNPRNNNQKGEEKKTPGDLDVVDHCYKIFRKQKDKNEMIAEMKNYFANNSTILFAPPDIVKYGEFKSSYIFDTNSSQYAMGKQGGIGNRICGIHLWMLPGIRGPANDVRSQCKR